MNKAKEVFNNIFPPQERYIADTLSTLYPDADKAVISKIVSDIKTLFSTIFHIDDTIDFESASNALFQQLHHCCTALVNAESGAALELVTEAVDNIIDDVVTRLTAELEASAQPA